MRDAKVSSAWRGWLKQDANAMKRGNRERKTLRNPPGTVLAHNQHKYDKMGRLNKDRGKK